MSRVATIVVFAALYFGAIFCDVVDDEFLVGVPTNWQSKRSGYYALNSAFGIQSLGKVHRIPQVSHDSHSTGTRRLNETAFFAVHVDTDYCIHEVDRRFLSTGLGTNHLACGGPLRFNWSTTVFRTLTRALSPGVLRVSGKHADETVFRAQHMCETLRNNSSPKDITKRFTVTGEKWKELHDFAIATGQDVTYGLNLCLRSGEAWDPTNSMELLRYNAKLGYKVIWQLGNEPYLFSKNCNMNLTADQIARDFLTLRKLLSEIEDAGLLVGPDVTHLPLHLTVDDGLEAPFAYLERFLRKAGSALNATTLHYYNVHKDSSTTIENFTDPDVLDHIVKELHYYTHVVKSSMEEPVERWIGEGSSVTSGGLINASSRFAAGFPLLNNLGAAARMNIKIFIYWNLISGNYELISRNGTPRALYWVCLLHKRLVGQRVLTTEVKMGLMFPWPRSQPKSQRRYVRVYAHCTSDRSSYQAGAVTLIVLNLLNDTTAVMRLSGLQSETSIDEYLLTPFGGSLDSDSIELNGKVLAMIDDSTLPDTPPRPLPAGSPISLPPRTYGFYVIKDARAAACIKSREGTE